jgi:hypothetical protein
MWSDPNSVTVATIPVPARMTVLTFTTRWCSFTMLSFLDSAVEWKKHRLHQWTFFFSCFVMQTYRWKGRKRSATIQQGWSQDIFSSDNQQPQAAGFDETTSEQKPWLPQLKPPVSLQYVAMASGFFPARYGCWQMRGLVRSTILVSLVIHAPAHEFSSAQTQAAGIVYMVV